MSRYKTIREYLDEMCPEEDMRKRLSGDVEVRYIPIDICERKLDLLCTEFELQWGTENYQSKMYFKEDGDILVSASIELVIAGAEYSRRLVGTTTFFASDYTPNTFFDSIASSLCTVNAASDLGDRFGRFLANQEKKPGFPAGKPEGKKNRRESVLMKPDKAIREQYARAVAAKDQKEVLRLESMYKFD